MVRTRPEGEWTVAMKSGLCTLVRSGGGTDANTATGPAGLGYFTGALPTGGDAFAHSTGSCALIERSRREYAESEWGLGAAAPLPPAEGRWQSGAPNRTTDPDAGAPGRKSQLGTNTRLSLRKIAS